MKKMLGGLVIILALVFATIASEFIKPYTNYFAKKLFDKDDPFNFKNEYELLIWQYQQEAVQQKIKGTIKDLNLKVEGKEKDVFAECVIDESIFRLNQMSQESGLSKPINLKTFQDLEEALSKFQPIMMEVQTKSVQSCLPKEEIETRQNISLVCNCDNVLLISPLAKVGDFKCGDSYIDRLESVEIDFKNKNLFYGERVYALIEDDSYYYGVDFLARRFLDSKLDEKQLEFAKSNALFNKSLDIQSSAVTLNRLTLSLDWKDFSSWSINEPYGWISNILVAGIEAKRQCKVTEKI
jgi:hypothetical protein